GLRVGWRRSLTSGGDRARSPARGGDRKGESMARSGLFLPAAAAALLAVLAPVSAPAQSGFQTDQRLNAMQDQMRDLTGRIEELTNEVNQLKAQLDRQASDTDLRFRQLQGGGGSTSLTPPPVPPNTATAEPPAQLRPPPGAGADFSQPPSRSGNLGTLVTPGPGRPPPPLPPEEPPPQTAGAGGGLPPGSAQDQYN